MSVIPVDSPNLKLMLQQDAQQLREFTLWVKKRRQSWEQNGTTQNMTNAGFSSDDQNTVLALIGDFHRLDVLMNGTLPSDATNMLYDCSAVLGVL